MIMQAAMNFKDFSWHIPTSSMTTAKFTSHKNLHKYGSRLRVACVLLWDQYQSSFCLILCYIRTNWFILHIKYSIVALLPCTIIATSHLIIIGHMKVLDSLATRVAISIHDTIWNKLYFDYTVNNLQEFLNFLIAIIPYHGR